MHTTVAKPAIQTFMGPVQPPERLRSLDVLRGVALLGMLLVHFYDYSSEGSGWTAGLKEAIHILASEKFFALFAFLFGAGFAIQLRRAEAKGDAFLPTYLRRLFGLFLFGLAAHALLGFNVLLGYSIFALPLLLIHRWSTRSLLLLALSFTLGWALHNLVIGLYDWVVLGMEGANRALDARWQASGARWSALSAARAQENYMLLLEARLQYMGWFYRQPWMVVPNEIPLFIAGLLAVRHGIFDNAGRQTRWIAAAMVVGLFAWATHTWLLPLIPEFGPRGVVEPLRYSSRLGQWLMYTYAGGILLLLTNSSRCEAYLAPLAFAGRMALTNYFLQILTIDVMISGYGFGVGEISPVLILPATLVFFGAQIAFSRIWLSHYRYGPLEWVWRCMTYGRWQTLRKPRLAF